MNNENDEIKRKSDRNTLAAMIDAFGFFVLTAIYLAKISVGVDTPYKSLLMGIFAVEMIIVFLIVEYGNEPITAKIIRYFNEETS